MNYTAKANSRASDYVLLLLAILIVWMVGSGCVSPQVVREVQTAKPLEADQIRGSVSGGITWAPTGVASYGIPANPNADLNFLIRTGRRDQKETQVPFNISVRMGPGEDGDWLGVHAATGLFFKRSTLVSSGKFAKYFDMPPEDLKPADWQETYFWVRSLYKAWIFGPILGAFISREYYIHTSWDWGGSRPGFVTRAQPFVSPFAGFYLRFVNEKRKKGFVRLRGFLANVSYFFLDMPLVHDWEGSAAGFPLGIELFLGGFVGSERRRFISQFTYGVSTDRTMMPRLMIGLTFGSKGKLL